MTLVLKLLIKLENFIIFFLKKIRQIIYSFIGPLIIIIDLKIEINKFLSIADLFKAWVFYS